MSRLIDLTVGYPSFVLLMCNIAPGFPGFESPWMWLTVAVPTLLFLLATCTYYGTSTAYWTWRYRRARGDEAKLRQLRAELDARHPS